MQAILMPAALAGAQVEDLSPTVSRVHPRVRIRERLKVLVLF